MYKVIYQTHVVSVTLFLLIYLVKTMMLLSNKKEGLAKLTKLIKVPEMIVSFLFLATGVYMLIEIPEVKSMVLLKLVAVFVSIPLAIIGFKKSNKALAVISLLLIISAYGLAEMSKKQKSKAIEVVTTGNSEMIEGVDIYTKACVSCHGKDGKLGLAGASDLSLSTLEKESIIEIISNGRGTMAPYKGQLSEKQINAVADYVKTLKH